MGCRALFPASQTSPDCAAGDCLLCTAVPIVCQNSLVSLFARCCSHHSYLEPGSCPLRHNWVYPRCNWVTSLLYYLHLHARPTLLCSPLPAPPLGRDFLEAIMMIFSIFSARFHRTRAVNLKWLPSPAIFPTAHCICSEGRLQQHPAWCCRSVSGHSSL